MLVAEGEEWLQRSEILGRPVFLAPAGRRLGEVCDLALATSGSAVLGLVLDGAWPHSQRILDWRAVVGWGPDVLLAGAELWLAEGAGLPAATLAGKPVLAPPGRELGRLDDLEFDPATGAVTAVGLSAGLVADLLHGKPRLTAGLHVGESALWAEPASPGEGREMPFELP